jgi:hypothetical protein
MKNALGHVGFGLILMAIFGALALAATRNPVASAWIAWAMQCAYWLGRERRDEEILTAINPHTEWWKRWNILSWGLDGQRDLIWPVLVNVLVPIVVALCLL